MLWGIGVLAAGAGSLELTELLRDLIGGFLTQHARVELP
jgi:hypothetical protein